MRGTLIGVPHPLDELPEEIGAPARRALVAAGYPTLRDVAQAARPEIEGLHGVGPKAVAVLVRQLRTHGLALRS